MAISAVRQVPVKQLRLCLSYLAGLAPAQGIGKAGSHPGEQAAGSVKAITSLLPTLPGERCSLGSQAGCGGKAWGEGRQQLLLNRCLGEQQPLPCPSSPPEAQTDKARSPRAIFPSSAVCPLPLFSHHRSSPVLAPDVFLSC